jgi:hypothetical protein
VHEWGTDTIVVGSDGSMQRGLHHEEEDLPGFVYNRIKAGSLDGAMSVHVKMETPVTYFYSDTPLTAKVSVGFPQGVFTQWYPAVQSFSPWVALPNAVAGLTEPMDPVFDLHFPFQSQICAAKFGVVANGLLDWGSVQILPRGTSASLPDASLDQFTWSYARDVDANAIRIAAVPGAMTTPQDERFLFYRGLGNFDLPARVTAETGGHVAIENLYTKALGPVFVLNVGADSGAFTVHTGGVSPGNTLAEIAPTLAGAQPLDHFVEALGQRVTEALDATGLYHDEATAMVNTWKRQWFRTPGLRLLYLVPQAWTDASIPLSIQPAPASTTRVMMIRVEVITPELEAADVQAAQKLAASDPAAQAHFESLGRFAEPRLRRAMSILGNPAYAEPFLSTLATANSSSAAGE